MKVALYDTEHFETTYTLIRVLQVPTNNITVFTTPAIENLLKHMLQEDAKNITWVNKKTNLLGFVYKMRHYCLQNKISILWLNTVSHQHLLFGLLTAQLPNTNILLTIHDAISSFSFTPHKDFKTAIQNYGRRLLMHNVNAYATLLSSTKIYLEKTLNIKKPILVLPGAVLEKTAITSKAIDQDFQIVIPGSIDEKRRDYLQVLQLADRLAAFPYSFEIVLLGAATSPYGKMILDKFVAATYKNIRLTVFTEAFVPQAIYDCYMATCHFVFAPLSSKFITDIGIAESYGVTKSSGSFFDAVRFGKPMLISNAISVPEELKNQCIFYNDINALAHFLLQLNHNPADAYTVIANKAFTNAKHFDLETVRQQVMSFLKTLTIHNPAA